MTYLVLHLCDFTT